MSYSLQSGSTMLLARFVVVSGFKLLIILSSQAVKLSQPSQRQ